MDVTPWSRRIAWSREKIRRAAKAQRAGRGVSREWTSPLPHDTKEQMTQRPAKLVLWVCRLAPVVAWGMAVATVTVPEGRVPWGSPAFTTLFLCAVLLYLTVVYLIVPELLAGGRRRSIGRRAADFMLAGLTAGLYMVAAYWLKVDGSLNMMVRTREPDGP